MSMQSCTVLRPANSEYASARRSAFVSSSSSFHSVTSSSTGVSPPRVWHCKGAARREANSAISERVMCTNAPNQ